MKCFACFSVSANHFVCVNKYAINLNNPRGSDLFYYLVFILFFFNVFNINPWPRGQKVKVYCLDFS